MLVTSPFKNKNNLAFKPNLITLIGFIFSSLPFVVLFGCFGTKMRNEKDNEIPRWFFFFETFCYFMYRMLDEMDGKQARRTGNASPLGLMFDHGCDSVSIGFQCMVIGKCLQIDDNWAAVLTTIGVCSSFYFTTLEEYYSGAMILPIGNGVTDGSLPIYIMFLAMGCFGNDVWRTPMANAGTPFEVTAVDVFAWALIALQVYIMSRK